MLGRIILIVVVVLIIALLVGSIKIVPQASAFVLERLGKFKTVWEAGLHVKIPIIDQVVRRVSLKAQVLDFPPQPVITKDNVTVDLDSVVFCKVFDPKLYTYGVENPIAGLQNLSATTLRNIVGELELDQLLTSRDAINQKLQVILDTATDPWGIKVTRVELKNIRPPQEIEEVMTKQMRAERERRQTVLEAQAHQEAVVSRAKGDKEAKVLAAQAERDAQIALAEGRAKSIEMVYTAESEGIKRLKEAGIDSSVIRWNGIKALKDVADGRATKIFMPTDLTGILSSLGVIGEALGVGDSTPVDNSPRSKSVEADDCCETDDADYTHSGITHEAMEASRRIENEVSSSLGERIREARDRRFN